MSNRRPLSAAGVAPTPRRRCRPREWSRSCAGAPRSSARHRRAQVDDIPVVVARLGHRLRRSHGSTRRRASRRGPAAAWQQRWSSGSCDVCGRATWGGRVSAVVLLDGGQPGVDQEWVHVGSSSSSSAAVGVCIRRLCARYGSRVQHLFGPDLHATVVSFQAVAADLDLRLPPTRPPTTYAPRAGRSSPCSTGHRYPAP
jgi:hypothetical protein